MTTSSHTAKYPQGARAAGTGSTRWCGSLPSKEGSEHVFPKLRVDHPTLFGYPSLTDTVNFDVGFQAEVLQAIGIEIIDAEFSTGGIGERRGHPTADHLELRDKSELAWPTPLTTVGPNGFGFKFACYFPAESPESDGCLVLHNVDRIPKRFGLSTAK